MLEEVIVRVEVGGKVGEVVVFKIDLDILLKMEQEFECFGVVVGFDLVFIFECIVDKGSYFFMEMNIWIQVEYCVFELCYVLKFVNFENFDDFLVVDFLVEVMMLLVCYGKVLLKLVCIFCECVFVEVWLNVINDVLKFYVGGVIEYWFSLIDGEICDDQGIIVCNLDIK